jgi:AmmeMemoRadiSam system protein B/AmmeMemoRadiSam system protein A
MLEDMVKKHSIHRIVLTCWILILIATSGQCRQKTKTEESSAAVDVRRPVVAGAFYPDSPQRLADQVDGFLAEVPEQPLPGRLIALVSPHAGYVYSGGVAAHAYKQLEGKAYHTVILIGSSHRASFPGASVYHRGGYETPLGTIPVNEEMARKVMSLDENLRFVSQAHVAEHSLEVQLPFLQRVLEDFRIVPIVTGPHLSFGELESVAQAVAQVAGEEVLIVASTDMSHYPPYEQARRVDRETLTAIESFSPQRVAENETRWLKEDVTELHCTLCGLDPVLITMMAAKILGADGVEVLKYANSGDVSMGDRERVVGYCAVAFYQGDPETPGKEMSLKDLSEELDRQEQVALLKIARESIVTGLEGKGYTPLDSPHPKLMEKWGAFVTLHKHGELRGCIGRFQPDIPLCQTVAQMAQAAAFSDHRFNPLSSEELADIEIEISVLSPLRKISSIDEIQLGKHGIWITKGDRSGCFLPQVATETGWSKQEFLEHCCSGKALLPKDAYLDADTDIYVFTAQVFHED